MNRKEIKGHAAMFSANIMWGLMSPFAKLLIIGGFLTPVVITNLRIGGAMLLFWLASFLQPKENVPSGDLGRLFIAALLGVVLNQGCFMFGVSLTSPADASIITTSLPLWAMILAAFILKEPVTWMKVAGIFLGACGALILIFGNKTSSFVGGNYLLGDLLVLAAQFSYALYLVLYKNFVSKYSLNTVMKWMFTFSFICVAPLSVNDLVQTPWSLLGVKEIIFIAFIVGGATYLSYTLIIVGQKTLRPTLVGMYNYVQPIVACLIAVVLGLDSFNIAKLAAICLIFSGVFLVTLSRSRADSIQRS